MLAWMGGARRKLKQSRVKRPAGVCKRPNPVPAHIPERGNLAEIGEAVKPPCGMTFIKKQPQPAKRTTNWGSRVADLPHDKKDVVNGGELAEEVSSCSKDAAAEMRAEGPGSPCSTGNQQILSAQKTTGQRRSKKSRLRSLDLRMIDLDDL